MTTASNLYAEKVFAEHPIGLWSLDDKSDYISLLSSQLLLATGGTSTVSTELIADQPFIDTSCIIMTIPDGTATISAMTVSSFSTNSLNDDLSSVSIGTYFYTDDQNISSIDFGYTDGTNNYTDRYYVSSFSRWNFISKTIESFEAGKTINLVIAINKSSGDTSESVVYLNGISAGQWSEEFSMSSLGISPVIVPSALGVGTSGIKALSYGTDENHGYYLVSDGRLLARNTSIPIVYGASGLTKIYPNPSSSESEFKPSVILPGLGFLHSSGQNKNYTAEFWLRVDSDAVSPRRIFGPIDSEDGLYVDGPFLTVKVGSYVESHYISEWYRPMLVDITYTASSITLIINGSEVLSITIDQEKLALSDGQDWLGFYAYNDVKQVEVDCVGIYPYKVSQSMAKRRFVFGQGVQFPENINSAYNGTSLFMDFPFTNYSNTYSYPDLGKWGQGYFDNISLKNNVLSSPDLSLPSFKFDSSNYSAWLDDYAEVFDETDPKINLRPTSLWDNVEGHIYFNNINILKQSIKSIYGVFRPQDVMSSQEILFDVVDGVTGNYLRVYVEGTRIGGYTFSYALKYGASAEEYVFYSFTSILSTVGISAGIELSRFSAHFGGNVAAFLGNTGRLEIYVGGAKNLLKTFTGDIYRIGFCNERNLSKISTSINSLGIITEPYYDGGAPDTQVWDSILNADGGEPSSTYSGIATHTATYTMIAKNFYGTFVLDVIADSYWEDYVPLSSLGKQVIGKDGDKFYELDFIQLNIDYPRPGMYLVSDGDTYYDTSNSLVRSYVTFQYIAEGSNKPITSFTNTRNASRSGVITPGDEWLYTKYEFVNNMVAYVPPGVNFKDISIVIHIEFKTNGVRTQPVKIKRLSLASKALDEVGKNVIGTRFGTEVYPYRKYGIYYDYKATNPFAVYRDSTPYLYLNKYSGIQPIGDFTSLANRGLGIQVNKKQSEVFNLASLQTAMRYENTAFPTTPLQIFEIQSKNDLYGVFIESIHPDNQRARVYVKKAATNEIDQQMIFFLNGKRVAQPVISLNEWNMLGIAFINNLDFGGTIGAIRITGPILVNNLTFYEETAFQQAQAGVIRQWSGVKTRNVLDVPVGLDWSAWSQSSWQDVLVISPDEYLGISPSEIFNIYTGTNKIIAGDTTSIIFGNYAYSIYQGVVSQAKTVTPV